jgi:hypothetical protein
VKVVRYIDGRLAMRPAKDHPNAAAWAALKEQRRIVQTEGGKVHCGCCWRTEDKHPLDLHHRTYDRFGEEQLSDVILLCRSCHTAITSRIREERYALGDRSLGSEETVSTVAAFRPSLKVVTVENSREESVAPPRFRPAFG